MAVTSLQVLDPAATGALEPIVSNDGKRLAWTEGQKLTVKTGITSQSYDLGSGTVSQPEFSPEGNRIVFSYQATVGAPSSLRILDLTNGAITEPMTSTGPLGEANNASFSSDGNRIVFATSQALLPGDNNGASDIYMLNLTDGSLVDISTTFVGLPVNGASFDPVFSPDGLSVAFTSNANSFMAGDTNGVSDVYLKNWADGSVTRISQPTPSTEYTRAAYDPVFAPNGSYVLFTVATSLSSSDLVLKSTSSGAVQTVTSAMTTQPQADISPDSASIVYITNGGLSVTMRPIAAGSPTSRVDILPGASLGSGGQDFTPRFLADGSGVIWATYGNDLVAADTTPDSDIYVSHTRSGVATVGGPGADTLVGTNWQADILDGGAGADTMMGGLGSDTYIVDNAGDVVIETSNMPGLIVPADVDRVLAKVSYVLSPTADIEDLSAADPSSTAALNLTGSDTNNNVSGNEGANILHGAGGNDFLFGNGGNDELYGDAGNDTLVGGAGFDLLNGGAGDDTYILQDLADTIIEAVGGGYDTVYAGFSYTLAQGQEIEVLSTGGASTSTVSLNFTGNEFGNVLYANNGANSLMGGDGDDSLFGLAGADSLLGGDGADKLYGGTGDDALLGGNGADYLLGDDGNDLLDGGAGADTMAGGQGSDTFIVDDANDVVQDLFAQGTDRVYATVSYTLSAGAQIEILAAGGADATAAINLTGNEYNNNLWGNSGNNVLHGGLGNDWLFGFDGNDTLYGDDGNDFLIGGNGADTLYGGDGNDVYQLDDALDTVVEGTSAGYDLVYVNASYTLTAGNEIEELSTGANAGSTTALDLTGNEFGQVIKGNDGANVITGNGGDDRLFGFGGSDSLNGGAGVDRLYGGDGADSLTGGADADFFFFDTPLTSVDIITDFVSGVDAIMLASSQFLGIAQGPFPDRTFTTGTQATDPSHRIIYDSTTGWIYFDQDGVGGIDAVHFATITPGSALGASDFIGF